MSLDAMTAVFRWGPRANWTPAQRNILLALADHVDGHGRAHPSQKLLAFKAGVPLFLKDNLGRGSAQREFPKES